MTSWKPEVFIIESLGFEDEKDNRFEGKILSDILYLGGKEPIYYYIRTKKELEKVNPYLNEKRLFVSACSAVNEDLAKVVIPRIGCYSLIGPIEDIYFQDAAIVWASFYHLMFKENPNAMKRKDLKPTLQNIVNTFGEPLNYFSRRERSPYFRKLTIQRNNFQPNSI